MTNLSEKVSAAFEILKDRRNDEAVVREFFKVAKGLELLDYLIEENFFLADEVPKPILTDDGKYYSFKPWHALTYLEKVARECNKKNDLSSALKIIRLLSDITENVSEDAKKNTFVWDSFAQVLSNLPAAALTEDSIKYLGFWIVWSGKHGQITSIVGEQLLANIIEFEEEHASNLGMLILDKLLILGDKQTSDKEFATGFKPDFIGDNYRIKKVLTNLSDKLVFRFGLEVIKCLAKKLVNWIALQSHPMKSIYWRAAIEDHEQNGSHDNDVPGILIGSIRNSAVALVNQNNESLQGLLLFFLNRSEPIFHRIGVYLSNIFYKYSNGEIWSLPLGELTSLEITHEFYHYLKENFNNFPEDKKSQIVGFIRNIEINESDSNKKRDFETSFKIRWLSALIGKSMEDVDQTYNTLVKEAGYEHDHPDFVMYFSIGWGGGEESPIEVTKLAAMSVSEIAGFAKSFKPDQSWRSPSARGLREAIEEVVKKFPKRFVSEISLFTECLPIYWAGLISAIHEVWNENKHTSDIEWMIVIDFIRGRFIDHKNWYDLSDKLGEGIYEPWENLSFLRASMRLINSFVENDKHSIPNAYLPDIKDLIILALDFTKLEQPDSDHDLLNMAINTPRGYAIDALMSYSLHMGRKAREEKLLTDEIWSENQKFFDSELAKCKGKNFEFSAIIASRLSNMIFLSKQWVELNLENLFSPQFNINFKAAWDGYSYSSLPNSFIEDKLWEKELYKKALILFKQKGRVRDKLLERLTIGYLHNKQPLNETDNDFRRVLEEFMIDDISHIIQFVWSIKEYIAEQQDFLDKVIDFWDFVLLRLDDPTESNKSLLSDLNLFVVFIDVLSADSTERLLKSVKYVGRNYHSADLVENLARLVNQYPKRVGEIYKAMLEGYVPTYPEEKIVQIMKGLEKHEELVLAREIDNIYLRKGGRSYLEK